MFQRGSNQKEIPSNKTGVDEFKTIKFIVKGCFLNHKKSDTRTEDLIVITKILKPYESRELLFQSQTTSMVFSSSDKG